jgi:hypothetical protein
MRPKKLQEGCTTMSEGRHEIEVAKNRLAAAKATASSAATIMDSAKLMEQTACTMATTAKKNKATAATLLKSSSKEVKEAKDIMKEVEKKWKFVAVDADAGDSPKKKNGRKKKRRKVSPSNASAETALEENNNGDDATAQNETAMAAARLENNIVVEGAGLTVINGTYKKLAAHCYEKEGQWNGAIGIFMIFQKGTHWFFGFRGDRTPYCQQTLYRTMSSCPADTPRKNGWMTFGDGVSPAPKLKW